MAALRRYDGTQHRSGATLKRWDGTTFRTGATLRRWTGTGWQPPIVTDPPGGDPGFVGATTVNHVSGTPIVIAVPADTQPGDLALLAVTFTNTTTTITDADGFTPIQAVTGFGSGTSYLAQRTGLTGGGTVNLAGTNMGVARAALVIYRGYTLAATGTPASRSSTSAVTTAPTVGGTGLHVVVGWEKSGSNSDNNPPTVPGVTQRAWEPWSSSAAAQTSVWVGDYEGSGADRTLTYLRTSGNGRGVQLRLE